MGKARPRLDRAGTECRLFFLVTTVLIVLAAACSQGREYSAAIKADVRELRAYAGETAQVTLRIKNRGRSEWNMSGPNPTLRLLPSAGRGRDRPEVR